MTGNIGFRTDINAMRAFAVAVVTLHHFHITGFRAGFIGVDIFFVISGYLMTKIVIDANDNRFNSVLEFYWARAKRIVPALLALCATLLVAGYALLLPSDYRLLAKHAGSSLGFFSNNVYYGEAGYFDISSQEKWLLHTWSLSVEWQFYIFFPLLMKALLRWVPPRHLFRAIIVSVGCGFFYCIFQSFIDPSAAFYLLPARAWEMLAGGLVLLITKDSPSNVSARRWVAAVGCSLLLTSMIFVDTRTTWPGALTVLPVLGTGLLLFGKFEGWVIRNAVMQALGRWSYSIYLWHWPVVVATAYLAMDRTPWTQAAGIGLSVALGVLSYRFVEAPARKWLGAFTLNRRVVTVGIGWCVMIGGAATIFLTDGAKSREIPPVARLADDERFNNTRVDQSGRKCDQPTDGTAKDCIYGEGPIGAVLIGDSHSSALVTAIAEALAPIPASVLHYSFTACPTILGIQHLNANMSSCPAFNAAAIRKVSALHRSVPLIVVNRWSSYIEGPGPSEADPGVRFVRFKAGESQDDFDNSFSSALMQTLCPIAASGRRVIVLQPIPEMHFNVPGRMARLAMMTNRTGEVVLPWSDYRLRHARALQLLQSVHQKCGVELVDPTEALCDGIVCRGSLDARPLYFDDDHLSEFGNKLLVPMLRKALVASNTSQRTE